MKRREEKNRRKGVSLNFAQQTVNLFSLRKKNSLDKKSKSQNKIEQLNSNANHWVDKSTTGQERSEGNGAHGK